ncbi:unnamed protein product [Rotaria sp. Silwood1]|nr:unnamed protein product [Rotaria sp. Silwood1]CAF1636245.1 unnamed protein product [Rotaria sp. Silwood1]
MGVQSSGKSTLLNLMFGTRLRASAGMCTRGVNIQLLKAEDRSEYDYVVILDSEGVRAPEFSGSEGATWRDNRLATFSILPADATIIMINNEEDTAAREVLPIVMLAYQQSELAAKSTNQLKTKLFFVYTRIDTNEKKSIPATLPYDYLRPENINSLIKLIRDELVDRFARGGVTLRCSEPCPLCGSPCRAAAGHTTDPSEDKRRHDCDYQPSGLFGTYDYNTRQLVSDSCSTNILGNYTFPFTSIRDQRPYSQFGICFPTWKQPPPLTTNANEVGQYIFYHYQNELAQYHKCEPCTNVPSSFNRSLDELEQKQKNVIAGITSE